MANARLAAILVVLVVGLSVQTLAAPSLRGFEGMWTETSVHDRRGMDYPEGNTTEWYGGKVMTVGSDRLTFADDVCFNPAYALKRGRLSDALVAYTRDKAVRLKRDFGVKDAGPFDYVEVHCLRGQYLRRNAKLPPIPVSQRDYHPWFLVKVAPDRIEMPFTHGTWIELTADPPAS